MITFNQAFGGSGGGAGAVGGWSTPLVTSRAITFLEPGVVVFSIVGAGGGGACAPGAGANCATGGNSAPWGRKKLTLAAGVAAPGASSTDGTDGANSTVSLNGSVILTAQGGEGGRQANTTITARTPVATVIGADYWVKGAQAGSATNTGVISGGAAVDILSAGLGRSPDRIASNTSIGGSIDSNTGNIPLGWYILGDWGFIVTEPSLATGSYGIPGRGATQSPAILAGAFGGGVQSTVAGFGGGGGGTLTPGTGGRSGSAYAFLTFTPEE